MNLLEFVAMFLEVFKWVISVVLLIISFILCKIVYEDYINGEWWQYIAIGFWWVVNISIAITLFITFSNAY